MMRGSILPGALALAFHLGAAIVFALLLDGYSHREFPLALLGAEGVPRALAFNLCAFVLPGMLAVVVPLLTGFVLGKEALAGLLIGTTTSGFLLAVMMANAGGAWDNAKKWIETGEGGGKGSDALTAAVVGDTVGDPFKDTSGPALNILIKLMSIVSLVFASAFGSGWFSF